MNKIAFEIESVEEGYSKCPACGKVVSLSRVYKVGSVKKAEHKRIVGCNTCAFVGIIENGVFRKPISQDERKARLDFCSDKGVRAHHDEIVESMWG